jgi:pilus assembly protein CpaE
MPDGATQMPADETRRGGDGLSVRYDRPFLIGFITDARSEEALRDGLVEISTEQLDFRRGGVRAAIAAMQKQATPRVLLVDVSGEEQPLSALGELAHVVEPDVCVLVIGEVSHMDFYREVTRGMGAAVFPLPASGAEPAPPPSRSISPGTWG